jgi:hypothetical protein
MQDGRISLPHRLLTFMQSAAYQKVGINIASSFRRLWNDCTENCHSLPFLGQGDLEHMAKTRTTTYQSVIGIEGLCASILRKHISRNPAISISSTWDQFDLPSPYIDHVVMEMYVIMSLHSVLSNFNNPKEVSKMTPGGTPVKMLAPDGRIITEGIVALDQPTAFKGVNVSATRVVMTVEKVHVPAYLINPTLLLSRQPTPLSAFGSVPFNLLCQVKHLQTSSNLNVGSSMSSESRSNINPAMLTSPGPAVTSEKRSSPVRFFHSFGLNRNRNRFFYYPKLLKPDRNRKKPVLCGPVRSENRLQPVTATTGHQPTTVGFFVQKVQLYY